MKEERNHDLKNYLKRNTQAVDPELQRDLWPQMLRRLDERSASVPWLDWALLGLLATLLLAVPDAIPIFLYHF